MINHTIKIPLYFQTLEIIISEDFDKAMEKYNVVNNSNFKINDDEAFVTYQNDKIYLFIREDVSAGIIAHESVHVCNYVFQGANIRLDIDNDEPYAYLMGWVVQEVHNTLKK